MSSAVSHKIFGFSSEYKKQGEKMIAEKAINEVSFCIDCYHYKSGILSVYDEDELLAKQPSERNLESIS